MLAKTERKICPLVKAKTEIIKFDNFNRPTAQGNWNISETDWLKIEMG